MNIVYAVDDGFCQHMAVSIFSLIDHNRKEDLHFHILADAVSEENQNKLRQLVEDEGKHICFYPIRDLEAELLKRVYRMDTGSFRITVLARLLMGSILPETVTKALYLDADTVVLRSLHDLYAQKLGTQLAAMAPEPTIYPEVKLFLGIPKRDPYFNSGVMLVNLSAWREENLEERCFAFYNKVGGKLPFADQDILNYALRGRVRPLPQRFNFFSNYYYFRYSTLCDLSSYFARLESRESFFVAKHHPVILHYAGAERPWRNGSRNHYRRAYFRYLRETPYAEALPEKGSLISMQAYHLMNIGTFLCPALRSWLSHLYFEKNIRSMLEKR